MISNFYPTVVLSQHLKCPKVLLKRDIFLDCQHSTSGMQAGAALEGSTQTTHTGVKYQAQRFLMALQDTQRSIKLLTARPTKPQSIVLIRIKLIFDHSQWLL